MPSPTLVKQGIARREAILAYITQHREEFGYSPTVAEITTAVGLNSNMATHRHLRILEAEGYLRSTPNVGRSLVVLKRPKR